MLSTILTASTKNFLEDLGKDLVKKAAATVVTEIVRSRIDLWKQMKLKRMRRDLDVVWREEDRIYKERQEELRKQREQVTGIDIRVKGAQQPDPPWAWEEIQLEYVVRGRGLKRSTVERAIRLSEDKYCSIRATISKVAAITSSHTISSQA